MHASTLTSSTPAETLPSSRPEAFPTERLRDQRARPLVFLAEDDVELRPMIGDALREAGFDVLLASSGSEMLKLLSAAARGDVAIPDAFVMDIEMPGCSGLDVLRAVRMADWRQPIVMITGFGDPELRERAASYEASVTLDKPIDPDDLVDVLDVLLRLAHASVLRPSHVSGREEEDEPEPETLRSPAHAARAIESPLE